MLIAKVEDLGTLRAPIAKDECVAFVGSIGSEQWVCGERLERTPLMSSVDRGPRDAVVFGVTRGDMKTVQVLNDGRKVADAHVLMPRNSGYFYFYAVVPSDQINIDKMSLAATDYSGHRYKVPRQGWRDHSSD